ncbi:MAG: FtsX-like permease family protein [Opitutaceae bacterium]|nr:FtsX-like permease family protein [Opitutaceae bacterium]
MSPNYRIAFRFLTAKKRSMLMSLACIILGVGLFVVTQATTSGFEKFFIKTLLGTDGAIKIEDRIQDTLRSMETGAGSHFLISQRGEGKKYIEGIEEPKLIIDGLKRFSNVSGTSVVLYGSAVIRSSFKNESVKIYGIALEDHLAVSDLGKQIVQGKIDDFRNDPTGGALVGIKIAERLQINVGDSFQVESRGQLRRYRVRAIYETGVTDIDKVRLYLNLGEARSLLKKPTGASYIQVGLFQPERAVTDATQMEEVLQHSATPWQEREKTWLNVFRALRFSSGITVSVFTLIAGLAMFNTLAMIVLEKTKEIAILRSMGYTRRDVSRIFLWQAMIVLMIGTVLGWLLGAAVTYAVSRTPISIRGIFATDTFIVEWSVWHYLAATVTAVVMVMTASLIPARRGARLEPGDVIRGTAQ